MKKAKNLFLTGLLFSIPFFSQSQQAESDCKLLCNEGFDVTTPPIPTVSLLNSSQISCWQTTASDGLIEAWGSGMGVPPYSGPQFIELNATQSSTVYQDFTATPGATLTLSFAHRGRLGVDQMGVEVGPVGGPYTNLGTFTDGTAAWGYYTVSYVVPASLGTNYTVRFTSLTWSGGNAAIGNFLDAVSLCSEGGTIPECEVCRETKVDLENFMLINAAGNAQAFFHLNSGGRVINRIRVTLLNFRVTPSFADCRNYCNMTNDDFGHITAVPEPLSGFPYVLMPYNNSVTPKYTNQVEMTTFSPRTINDFLGINLKFPPIMGSAECSQLVEACFRIEMIDENCVVCDRVICTSSNYNAEGGDPKNKNTSGSASENNRMLKVYPNPSNGNFTISTKAIGEGCRYELMSPEGKSVKTGAIEGMIMDLNASDLLPGVYTIFVFKGAEAFTEKIAIIK